MEYFSHFLRQARTPLASVCQCPISNRVAIHNQVIVVSDRNRAAIRAFLMSPFGRCFNSSSIQPASRNISLTNRCDFCASDPFNLFKSVFTPTTADLVNDTGWLRRCAPM